MPVVRRADSGLGTGVAHDSGVKGGARKKSEEEIERVQQALERSLLLVAFKGG